MLDGSGVARTDKAWMKVTFLVGNHREGVTVEQMLEDYPQLTPGQIHSALAHYYDHQADIDASMAERDRVVDEIEKEQAVRNADLYEKAQAARPWFDAARSQP